jgi:hypothetical protein
MKNPNQINFIENALACRAKASALRESNHQEYSPAIRSEMLAIANRWDDLAADYETSILKFVD